MKILILAGGFGTRLLPLTENYPKPLLPVGGKPIIEYILDRLPCEKIILSTNSKFAKVFHMWRNSVDRDVDLVIEEPRREEEKLGSIGALLYVIKEKNIDEDILVVAGDNIFDFNFADFLTAYQQVPLIGLCNIKDKERIRKKYGVAVVKKGKITKFLEKPEQPPSTLVSMGCFVYPRNVLPLFSQFLKIHEGKDAPGYFNQWLCKKEEIDAFIWSGRWHDIGDRESYIRANMDYSGGTYIGKDCDITNCTIEHSVILDRAVLADSHITDCVIAEDVCMKGVTLKKCIVGEGTRIRKC